MSMQLVRRVLLNLAALLAAYVLPRSLTFAAALIAARILQPAAFGAYGTAAALAFSLSVLATLGMLPLLVREIARSRDRADELVAAAHRIKGVLSLAMLAALLGATRLLGMSPSVTAATLLLGLGHVAWAFAENYGARLQAEERMKPWLQANLVFGCVSGLLAAIAVMATHSVAWFCAGFAAGQLAALLYLVARDRQAGAHQVATNWRASLPPLARATMPFAAAFFMLTVFYKGDVLLLSRLRDVHDAGIYAAGYKLVDVVHALAVVAAAAVYPRLARVRGASAAGRALELFLLLAAAGAGCLWLLRAPLVALLYGSAYDATAHALAWLAPAAGVLTLNIFAGYVLAIRNRIGLLGGAYALGTAIKIVLGLMLIPDYGASGMAIAMLGAESALAATLLVALHAAGVSLPARQPVMLCAVTVAAAAVCDVALPPELGAAVFVTAVGLLFITGDVLTVTERDALRQALRPARMTAGSA
jgi:O-antigen/teichoic acid export membrane protein